MKPSRATPTLKCNCSGSDTSLAHCCNLAGGPGIPESPKPQMVETARNSGTDETRKEAGRSQTLRVTSVWKCSSSHTIFWVWKIKKSPGRKNGFVSLELLQWNSTFSCGKDTSTTSREKQREVCCLSSVAFLCYDFHLSGLLLLGVYPTLVTMNA